MNERPPVRPPAAPLRALETVFWTVEAAGFMAMGPLLRAVGRGDQHPVLDPSGVRGRRPLDDGAALGAAQPGLLGARLATRTQHRADRADRRRDASPHRRAPRRARTTGDAHRPEPRRNLRSPPRPRAARARPAGHHARQPVPNGRRRSWRRFGALGPGQAPPRRRPSPRGRPRGGSPSVDGAGDVDLLPHRRCCPLADVHRRRARERREHRDHRQPRRHGGEPGGGARRARPARPAGGRLASVCRAVMLRSWYPRPASWREGRRGPATTTAA